MAWVRYKTVSVWFYCQVAAEERNAQSIEFTKAVDNAPTSFTRGRVDLFSLLSLPPHFSPPSYFTTDFSPWVIPNVPLILKMKNVCNVRDLWLLFLVEIYVTFNKIRNKPTRFQILFGRFLCALFFSRDEATSIKTFDAMKNINNYP